jgi:hypothetical protein
VVSVTNVPGLDKLSIVPVRQISKWDNEKLKELMKAAISTGQHPSESMQTSWVVIRKPGQHEYMPRNASHSICLLHCIGKVVENVVTDLPAAEAEKRERVNEGR